jgi:tetratricopeptide (TPR) repeat protein
MNRLVVLTRVVFAALALVLVTMGPVQAIGSKEKSPEEEAADLEKKATAKYNDGVKKMDKAKKYLGEEKQDKAKKELEKAAGRFKEAVEYKPDFPEALNNLGFSLRLTGRYDEALQHYNKAIELRPDFMEAHEYRGRAYLAMDSVQLAKAEYEWLLEKEHLEESELLKLSIDAWVMAKALGKRVSAEKLSW